MNGKQNSSGAPFFIVILAGTGIVAIALIQTVTQGAPDKVIGGALVALALGGGVGRVANQLISTYVQSQIDTALGRADPGDRDRPKLEPSSGAADEA